MFVGDCVTHSRRLYCQLRPLYCKFLHYLSRHREAVAIMGSFGALLIGVPFLVVPLFWLPNASQHAGCVPRGQTYADLMQAVWE